MSRDPTKARIWRRGIFWPSDHGSWVFVLSPLLIGVVAGGRWQTTHLYLIVATLCGFLLRQPVTVAVKALSGRRSEEDLTPALFWTVLYSSVAVLLMLGLHLRGYTYVLGLAIPGLLVFFWHLYLVTRREERGQRLLALWATACRALAATAGFWIGVGRPEALGWLLWALAWAQSAASVICVYVRLQQRTVSSSPEPRELLKMTLPALTICSLNLLAVGILGVAGITSRWLFVAFLPQWFEALCCFTRPATGWKPSKIGYRQLALSVLFTLLFLLTWQ